MKNYPLKIKTGGSNKAGCCAPASIPVTDVGPGQVVPVRSGDGGMSGKGGRGKGATSRSNMGPSANTY